MSAPQKCYEITHCVYGGLYDGLNVVIRDMHKPWLQRDEGLLVMQLTGSRQGGQRAPMERVSGSDHLVGSTRLLLAILAGQPERLGYMRPYPQGNLLQVGAMQM